jgi:signal peptidase I
VLLVLALVAALLIKTFLVQAFYIPSGSMQPTLKKGDRVLVNKLAYRLGDPHRGDVVVFERPPSEPDTEIKDLIKRVIGLPGETIATDEIGRILVDGQAIDESGYLPEGALSTTRIPEQRIPDDHYWVMGDNRGQSKDSRVFGPIPRSLLVGNAFVRVWPLGDFSGL